MQNWEDILTGYLEGTESRADAEALRWKIHLAIDAREEVEAVLRLADEVGAALCSVVVPEGAAPRLLDALHGIPEWNAPSGQPRWQPGRAGAEAGAAGATAGGPASPQREDAVNGFIEGARTEAPEDSPEPGDEELASRLRQSRALASALSDLARRRPPEGATDRMLARFRSGPADGSSEIDEPAAERFLHRLRTGSPRPAPLATRPDVLAASTESNENAGNIESESASDDPSGTDPSGRRDAPPRDEPPVH